ncbi:MAG: glycosyl hydrolase 2 galactose-binding domain-containing protein [Actinomycetota bacterium]
MAQRHVRVAVFASALAIVGSAVAAVIAPGNGIAFAGSGGSSRTSLDAGWSIRSSADVDAGGSAISTAGFSIDGWYPVTLPSTVLAGLVANGEYPNLYLGTNLQNVWAPRFQVPWWYRTEFALSDEPGVRTQLHFDGINYRADVYVNGTRIASSNEVIGTFRTYTFDITDAVHAGTNALAVRVYPVDPNRDLTITWIDWSPLAPDHGMGIWHDVWLTRTGPVSVSDPQVVSDLPLPATDSADLTATVSLTNGSDLPVIAQLSGEVSGSMGAIAFSQAVTLDAGESKLVTFAPGSYPQLHLSDPPVWWPYQMGTQPLEHMTIIASVDGVESDSVSTSFGIREVTSEFTSSGARRFLINGKPILIRGGGWASDMLLRPVPGRIDAQLGYVRDLGLNTVRLEGKLESDHFFDEADRLGILVMPGWMCCDRWQESWKWSPDEKAIARASMTSQAIRMRNHPSVFTFLIGSDTKPVVSVQKMYVKALRDARWPNPILASASGDTSSVLGPTGVKMTGPYDWIPPSYWGDPRAQGGADGFNTETSAGQSIPELESVKRMLSPDERRALWMEPQTPQYHAGVGDSVFKTFHIFDRAMTARMGAPTSLADYVEKAQVMSYESERAMYEAFSRNKYGSTGVIQWMLNNAWPSLHWNLFDWFLEPNGSTFGAKIANEPLHIQYSYVDRSVAVVNQTLQDATGLRADAQVFDLNGVRRWGSSSAVDVGADGVMSLFQVPQLAHITPTYFLELTLADRSGDVVSRDVYWLSTAPETLRWRASTWFFTPTKTYADFTALSDLPTVQPTVTACASTTGVEGTTRVTVTNDSDGVAFFVRLRLTAGKNGPDVTPVDWSDGYITLMPGEQRTVSGTYRTADLHGAEPSVELSGWNVPRSDPPLGACA